MEQNASAQNDKLRNVENTPSIWPRTGILCLADAGERAMGSRCSSCRSPDSKGTQDVPYGVIQLTIMSRSSHFAGHPYLQTVDRPRGRRPSRPAGRHINPKQNCNLCRPSWIAGGRRPRFRCRHTRQPARSRLSAADLVPDAATVRPTHPRPQKASITTGLKAQLTASFAS